MAKRHPRKLRKIYKTLVGSHRKSADAIYKLKDKILGGTVIAVDPGSNSLGYAVYTKGLLVESGTVITKGAIGERLAYMVAKLSEYDTPDVAVTEFVRTGTGHVYLTWASGAAMAALGSKNTIEVHTGAWKKLVTQSYVKNDENDAIAIGAFVVAIAKETE